MVVRELANRGSGEQSCARPKGGVNRLSFMEYIQGEIPCLEAHRA